MTMRWMMTAAMFAILAVFPQLMSGVVVAHHSQAGFATEADRIILEGTVAEYRWRNPHVLVFWDVEGENGEVVRWAGEDGVNLFTTAEAAAKDLPVDTSAATGQI